MDIFKKIVGLLGQAKNEGTVNSYISNPELIHPMAKIFILTNGTTLTQELAGKLKELGSWILRYLLTPFRNLND